MASEKQWRRTWKEDLKAKPWKRFEIMFGDAVAFFSIKYHFTSGTYEIMITDFSQVWYEALDDDAVRKRNKKLNPGIEAPVEKLMDHIKDSLEDKKKSTEYSASYRAVEDSNEEKICFTVNSKLAGLPFTWKFSGKPANKDMVADQMTFPLMSMVAELNRRQEELCKILHAKDKEIDDLKGQGVQATRKHIETSRFDDTAFQNNMQFSKGFENNVKNQGRSALDTSCQQLYQEVMMKRAWFEHEEGADDPPEESQAGVSQAVGTTGQSWANRLPPSLAISPKKSPQKSKESSPSKAGSAASSPNKEVQSELLRRKALEKRLLEEGEKKEEKQKKKKKMKF